MMGGCRRVGLICINPADVPGVAAVRDPRAPPLQLAPFFGGKRLDRIGRREIEQFMAWMSRTGRSPKTTLNALGVLMVDLTPAAIGGLCVPPVNLETHAKAQAMNVNMISCAGQATIPMVNAVSRIQSVSYAEIIATVSSKSIGPGTRANLDEFTYTTSSAVCAVGGSRTGKALVIINPADPPMIMRNTIYCLTEDAPDQKRITESILQMITEAGDGQRAAFRQQPGRFRQPQQVGTAAGLRDGDEEALPQIQAPGVVDGGHARPHRGHGAPGFRRFVQCTNVSHRHSGPGRAGGFHFPSPVLLRRKSDDLTHDQGRRPRHPCDRSPHPVDARSHHGQ